MWRSIRTTRWIPMPSKNSGASPMSQTTPSSLTIWTGSFNFSSVHLLLRRRDLFARRLVKPVGAQVALARIGEDGEDPFSLAEFTSGNAACMKDRAGRNAAENTFLCREAVSGRSGFFISHYNDAIDHASV